jgi:hypothetical protein
MAPADIEDFRPEPRKTKTPIRLEDIFDESLLGSNDAPVPEESTLSKRLQAELSKAESIRQEEAAFSTTTNTEPGLLAALGNDEFEVEVTSADTSSIANESGAGAVELGELPLESIKQQDSIQSVAPVAKIVRTADVETRRVTAPAAVPSFRVEPKSQLASEEGAQHEDTLIVEEAMDDLSDQEIYKSADGGREHLEIRRPSRLVGFLVSFELDRLGTYIELREGRLLVTREGRVSDNCLVISHPSVSSMHAIMRISSNGAIMILDQLSEHGTKIKLCDSGKEEALLGDKSTLEHGDVVIFGECAYHVCILKGI